MSYLRLSALVMIIYGVTFVAVPVSFLSLGFEEFCIKVCVGCAIVTQTLEHHPPYTTALGMMGVDAVFLH